MVGVISYHKNISKIYPKEWVEEYKYSILNQTYKYFNLFEVNYGGGTERIFEHSEFESKEFPSFVYALNYLLDKLFDTGLYDVVLNTNADDVYALDWVERQIKQIEQGYDLVSSNFSLVKENKIVHTHSFDKLNIEEQLNKNHNIISHPSVAYSAEFWKRNRYVPEELPLEDLKLWQRAIKNSKFIILPDILLYHRLHDNSVCQSENH